MVSAFLDVGIMFRDFGPILLKSYDFFNILKILDLLALNIS